MPVEWHDTFIYFMYALAYVCIGLAQGLTQAHPALEVAPCFSLPEPHQELFTPFWLPRGLLLSPHSHWIIPSLPQLLSSR